VPAKSRNGYMTMVEFATSVVLVGSVSHALAKGFVVVCAAFFEWGFGLPPHQFLCSLLRSYGLEQHHLTSSGILHMAAFVTLCEAYIGIEPLLKLWSHFFEDQLWPNLGMGAASLDSVDILVHPSPGFDTYFSIPQPDSPFGWQKA
jgi:hypothetical protein